MWHILKFYRVHSSHSSKHNFAERSNNQVTGFALKVHPLFPNEQKLSPPTSLITQAQETQITANEALRWMKPLTLSLNMAPLH